MPLTELGWESEAHYQARRSKTRSTRSGNTERRSSRRETIDGENVLPSEAQGLSSRGSRRSNTTSSRKPSDVYKSLFFFGGPSPASRGTRSTRRTTGKTHRSSTCTTEDGSSPSPGEEEEHVEEAGAESAGTEGSAEAPDADTMVEEPADEEEPSADEPAAEEPASEEPPAEEPTAEEPAPTEESAAEEPAPEPDAETTAEPPAAEGSEHGDDKPTEDGEPAAAEAEPSKLD
ncbi:hypothetical protein IAR50_006644 [Cryptococcus sp. DSM 104548]